MTPDDPLPIVEQALREYQVRWLVLESDHITPSLAPLLAGTERPAWLSTPTLSIAPLPRPPGSVDTSPVSPGGISAASLPRVALYAVCFDPADTRCAP